MKEARADSRVENEALQGQIVEELFGYSQGADDHSTVAL